MFQLNQYLHKIYHFLKYRTVVEDQINGLDLFYKDFLYIFIFTRNVEDCPSTLNITKKAKVSLIFRSIDLLNKLPPFA